MNSPDRELDAFLIERFLPCKDMLIGERAVEIKQKGRFDAHSHPKVGRNR